MNPQKQNILAYNELLILMRQGVITQDEFKRIAPRYPQGTWDCRTLSKWFLLFGAISIACGCVILFHTYFDFTIQTAIRVVGGATLAAFYGGHVFIKRGLLLSGRSLELLGGLSLIGFTFLLASLHNDGSGNWPAPLLMDLGAILALSYALCNPLLLVLTVIVFFTWFGGVTGYLSGWGAYYFGMNYPLRFLFAALSMCLFSVFHMYGENTALAKFRGFSKVWLSSGLFLAEMSLWLLSIFGNFGAMDNYSFESTAYELLTFNALWAASNSGIIWLGSKRSVRMLVGYGVTFLIIQMYTIFFQYIAAGIGPILSTFGTGFSALFLAKYLEGLRKSTSISARDA